LDITTSPRRPEVVVHEENLSKMRSLISEGVGVDAVRRRVLVHPGTSKLALDKGIIKTWPPADWAALIDRLLVAGDTQVILAGGPDDETTIAEIVGALGASASHSLFYNAYGKTSSLRDLVALMQLSDALVCVDSAPMHLGVGLHKPMVALFGPTDPGKLLWPDARFVPLRDAAIAAHIGNRDVFTSGIKSESHINIPLETVYESTMLAMSRLGQSL
jgi:ADP-heptose:LPS heptosyltransferase